MQTVDYEWHEPKRQKNLEKHNIDFIDANLVFKAKGKITLNVTRIADQERRFADFAKIEGRLLKLVYTLRANKVRCISLRVASQTERKTYEKAKTNTLL